MRNFENYNGYRGVNGSGGNGTNGRSNANGNMQNNTAKNQTGNRSSLQNNVQNPAGNPNNISNGSQNNVSNSINTPNSNPQNGSANSTGIGNNSVNPALCATVHRMKPGETLYQLSKKYRIDYNRLMMLNGITDPHNIPAGREICIPPIIHSDANRPAGPGTNNGRPNTGRPNQRPNGGRPNPNQPGGRPGRPPHHHHHGHPNHYPPHHERPGQNDGNSENQLIHIIKPGDTLYSISRRYNVPLKALMRANHNIDPYNLRIGSKLRIPINNTNIPNNNQGTQNGNSSNSGSQNNNQNGNSNNSDSQNNSQGGQNGNSNNSASQNGSQNEQNGNFNNSGSQNDNQNEQNGNSNNPGSQNDSQTEPNNNSDNSNSENVSQDEQNDQNQTDDDFNDSGIIDSNDPNSWNAENGTEPYDPEFSYSPENDTDCDYQTTEYYYDPYDSNYYNEQTDYNTDYSVPEDTPISTYVSDNSADGIIYNVSEGETLTQILSKFGICYYALLNENPCTDLRGDLSNVTLCIPYEDRFRRCPQNQEYIVKTGDSIAKIASNNGLSTDDLLILNPTRNTLDFSIIGSRICINK